MKTIEVKTSELEGAALDWAVAHVELIETSFRYGRELVKVHDRGGIKLIESIRSIYSPSTDWSQGGPLIEKYRAYPIRYDDTAVISEEGRFFVLVDSETLNFGDEFDSMEGSTPLIAACRAIVASKLGDTVQVPADLIGGAA